MTKSDTILINKVKRYLYSFGIKTMTFNDGMIIVGLVSKMDYHYIAIEIGYDVDPMFYHKRRPFKFARVKGRSFDYFVNQIDCYLNEKQLHNRRQDKV